MLLKFEKENIIKLLGIESLLDAQKIDLLTKMGEIVDKRLFLRLLDSLGVDKQQEFMSLLENNDQPTIESFISAQIPDFNSWVAEEVDKVKQEMTDILPK